MSERKEESFEEGYVHTPEFSRIEANESKESIQVGPDLLVGVKAITKTQLATVEESKFKLKFENNLSLNYLQYRHWRKWELLTSS